MSAGHMLESRVCPVCGADVRHARLFLPGSVDPTRLSGLSYASRKVPEFMSYRLVRCLECDVVYACEAPVREAIHDAYQEAGFDSTVEAQYAADSYALALKPWVKDWRELTAVLEIGAGTGAFLERLLRLGCGSVVGVEPSPAAIAAATPGVKPYLREGVFDERDYTPNCFSAIFCFMTLEHVPDPRGLVQSCCRLLRPGGLLAVITHNYRAVNNRLLGRHSPIIDVEHLQLFSPDSIRCLLSDAGLSRVSTTSFRNRYPLAYWVRLLPLPRNAKRRIGLTIDRMGLGSRALSLNVGNLLAVGWKPTLL